MSVQRYLRRNVYRWHRITSMIVVLPLLLWTISGFLHPVMNNFKPDVRNQQLPALSIDTSKIRLSPGEALSIHGIKMVKSMRIVKIYSAFYYQVKLPNADTLSYFSCYNAQWLPRGDMQYAGNLAQRFLTEPNGKKEDGDHHGAIAANINETAIAIQTAHTAKPNISEIEMITGFNQEYKKSNRLLPVYKVSFDRGDGIRLYIATENDKLAAAVDDKKALFSIFFSLVHSWSFMDGTGIFKNIVLGILSLLCLASAFLGFYVYNLTGRKKTNAKAQPVKNRHRTLGNLFVLTTMLYAFSGAWHSLHKIGNDKTEGMAVQNSFATSDLQLDKMSMTGHLQEGEKLSGVSIVSIKDNDYWQYSIQKGKEKFKRYIETKTGKTLKFGDQHYAAYLAAKFSGLPAEKISNIETINAFNHHYSMMNKRLPVIEIGYSNGEDYYIETATGRLSAIINEKDRAERFSFSNFHMHHYWEMWLDKKYGKSVRNSVLIASTLGLLILAITGLMMYLRKKRAKIAG